MLKLLKKIKSKTSLRPICSLHLKDQEFKTNILSIIKVGNKRKKAKALKKIKKLMLKNSFLYL